MNFNSLGIQNEIKSYTNSSQDKIYVKKVARVNNVLKVQQHF